MRRHPMPMRSEPPAAPLTVVAAQVRVLGDAEEQLFELCGRWSAQGDEPAARSFFASQSAFHAWRAEEWRRRQPASVLLEEVPGGAGLLPAGWGEVVARSELVGADAPRLAVWLELLVPSLHIAARRFRSGLRPVADAGLIRLVRIVDDDVLEQWSEGQSLLADWAGPVAAGAVASAVGELLPVLWRAHPE